ncbi:hypothetical protein PIB30_047003 [Stylosanthes scabra]|uniref:RRM domain-containing protein n=1 Tax=Stylosanthes scabra TaxID=79078 RepID=A0ABU6YGS3_9FABA|nr:hypothetical protein [Stylosanthes scabra]
MRGRVGVCGRVWRRVAHSEDAGFASRRSKGESVGKGAFGVLEDGYMGNTRTWSDIVQGRAKTIADDAGWVQIQKKRYNGKRVLGQQEPNRGRLTSEWQKLERRPRFVFVDNLSTNITNGRLYNIFGRFENVVDIFISRKMRKGTKGPFAFVRFDSNGGLVRAIEKLRSAIIEGRRIIVNEAKFKRGQNDELGDRKQERQDKMHDTMPIHVEETRKMTKVKRTVEVQTSTKMQELLDMSILAEIVEPIKLGLLVKLLDSIMENMGKVECRDLGANKCIPSFESKEMRHKELDDELLLEQFIDLRPYCGYKWSHSRRVWIELMGVPIHTWSEDTISRIAMAIGGKLIMKHELTEETVCLGVARILIETCQWEPIREWIDVKCEDTEFEVYAKEFGCEVLSFQVHPDASKNESSVEVFDCQDSIDGDTGNSLVVEETPLENDDEETNVGNIPNNEGKEGPTLQMEGIGILDETKGGDWAQNGVETNEEARLDQ